MAGAVGGLLEMRAAYSGVKSSPVAGLQVLQIKVDSYIAENVKSRSSSRECVYGILACI